MHLTMQRTTTWRSKYQIQDASNPELFDFVSFDAESGDLTFNAAWGMSGRNSITVSATDTSGLSPDQFAKIIGHPAGGPGRAGDRRRLDRQGETPPRAEPARPRHRLGPCERNVRDRLFAFYDWCAQNDDIPELLSLARTVSRWEDEIVCAVLTGVTNAASESLNRLAKLEARLAYGFRNPANQRRRVRIACTRGRRQSRTATSRRTRPVTGPEPHPG